MSQVCGREADFFFTDFIDLLIVLCSPERGGFEEARAVRKGWCRCPGSELLPSVRTSSLTLMKAERIGLSKVALLLPSWSTQERGFYTWPGQQNRAHSVCRDVGKWALRAWGWDSRASPSLMWKRGWGKDGRLPSLLNTCSRWETLFSRSPAAALRRTGPLPRMCSPVELTL